MDNNSSKMLINVSNILLLVSLVIMLTECVVLLQVGKDKIQSLNFFIRQLLVVIPVSLVLFSVAFHSAVRSVEKSCKDRMY